MKIVHESGNLLLPHSKTLFDRQAVYGALGIEDGVDPPHGFYRKRGFRQLCQLEEVAPPMGPAQGFCQWNGFAALIIEIVEPVIGISLQDAGGSSQVLSGMHALPGTRVVLLSRKRALVQDSAWSDAGAVC